MKTGKRTALVISLVIMLSSLSGVFLFSGGVEGISRGSFATHDAGNFTIIIDDDAGATGWNTLEFPPGADRLSSASFGVGVNSDTVDFGNHFEFQTMDPLNISIPGNYTDEEGYCSFTGWSGEDFEGVNITQRTFVNRYIENTRGSTGRWMIIDYEVDSPVEYLSPIYIIQTMNVDLGASATDDKFSFIPEINTTVISDGTTFVGLGFFDLSGSSYFNGHNAGVYGPGVYSGENEVWDQMSTPNNQTSSVTGQDWYMDISARVPENETGNPFHVSFAVLVGSSLFDIKAAYNDAVNGLRGFWTGPWLPNWSRGTLEMEFSYEGPFFPPASRDLELIKKEGEGPWENIGIVHPDIIPGSRKASYLLNTTELVPDWGSISWTMDSDSRFGFRDMNDSGIFKVDNKGPDTSMLAVNDDPTGTLTVLTNAGDRGGSGLYSTFMSMDGIYYFPDQELEVLEDGTDFDFFAYTVDMAGNQGPTVSLIDQVNDGTPPQINLFTLEPVNIDENTVGPITVLLRASDATSGIDISSAKMRYGITTPTSEWIQMDLFEGNFTSAIDLDWDALQGSELAVKVMISDMLGNSRDMTIKELIDPLNDPPEFSISLSGERWSSEDIGLSLEGVDPDGDDVTFSFDYRLGNGNWKDVPSNSLEETDPYHFLLDIPREDFEGLLQIQCTVDDGTDQVPLPVVSRDIDMKPPSLDIIGHPGTGWTTVSTRLKINSTDSISGISSLGFMVEKGGISEFLPVNEIGLNTEGLYNVTAMVEDKAGNKRSMVLDPIRIDLHSPVISNVTLPVMDKAPGDDLSIGFKVSDTLGFDLLKVVQDPSLYITSYIISGGTLISTGSIIPVQGNSFKAFFEDPFTTEIKEYSVKIDVSDEAGNQNEYESPKLNVSTPFIEEEPPFDIEFPEEVVLGEDLKINITWEGPLVLEARYPGTSISWIITAERTSGNERTYDLPGSYSSDDIQFKVHYGDVGSDEVNMTYPSDWYHIKVSGWADSDGDLLSNAFESRHGLDPFVMDDIEEDEDGDGLNLLEEMYNLTDPDDKDSDGDDLNDGWEAEMGTLPFRNDRNEDPDSDGWFNFKEFDGETDPRDPEDHPEEPPATKWYWIVLIVLVLLGIIGYFLWQTINRKKLEDDLEAMDEEMSWDLPKRR